MKPTLLVTVIAALVLSGCTSTSPEQEKQNSRLLSSLRFSTTARLEYTLNQGADPNVCDKYGTPALVKAAAFQKPEHVKKLLERGANVNLPDADGETALFAAASRNSMEILTMLLENGAELNRKGRNGRTPAMESARVGNLEMLTLLLEKGADLRAKDDRGADLTTYAAAAKQNGVKILEFLKTKGLEPDLTNTELYASPFLRALFFENVETGSYLLEKMPDLNSSSDMKEIGKIAAFYAISHNKLEMVKELVKKKLVLNYKEPLSFKMVNLLKVDGVYKLAVRNNLLNKGYTPLMYACIYGHPEIIDFLIDSGADPFILSMEGRPASDYAKDLATSQMIERKTKAFRKNQLDRKVKRKGLTIEKDKSIKRATIL